MASISSRLNVQVVTKDLLKVDADVAVCSTNPNKNLSKGDLAKHVLRNSGPGIQRELYECNGGEQLKNGQVAKSRPGRCHRFKELYFVCLHPWSKGNQEVLKGALQDCFYMASAEHHKSIVIPALGMGFLKYPPVEVAQAVMEATLAYSMMEPSTNLETVYIALHRQDEDVMKAFVEICIQNVERTKVEITDLDNLPTFDISLAGAEQFDQFGMRTKFESVAVPASNHGSGSTKNSAQGSSKDVLMVPGKRTLWQRTLYAIPLLSKQWGFVKFSVNHGATASLSSNGGQIGFYMSFDVNVLPKAVRTVLEKFIGQRVA